MTTHSDLKRPGLFENATHPRPSNTPTQIGYDRYTALEDLFAGYRNDLICNTVFGTYYTIAKVLSVAPPPYDRNAQVFSKVIGHLDDRFRPIYDGYARWHEHNSLKLRDASEGYRERLHAWDPAAAETFYMFEDYSKRMATAFESRGDTVGIDKSIAFLAMQAVAESVIDFTCFNPLAVEKPFQDELNRFLSAQPRALLKRIAAFEKSDLETLAHEAFLAAAFDKTFVDQYDKKDMFHAALSSSLGALMFPGEPHEYRDAARRVINSLKKSTWEKLTGCAIDGRPLEGRKCAFDGDLDDVRVALCVRLYRSFAADFPGLEKVDFTSKQAVETARLAAIRFQADPSNPRSIYEASRERLQSRKWRRSDPEIDGSRPMADYYGELLDDDVFSAIKQLSQIHLTGNKVVIDALQTDLAFVARLRCVDSLSDYLILALQTVVSGTPFEVEKWRKPTGELESTEETGYLSDGFVRAGGTSGNDYDRVLRLVHISELMSRDRLSLSAGTVTFRYHLDADGCIDNQADVPRYCFVSHSWVDSGMPDTEDGKFYRAFLLMVLSIYTETGIEYYWIDFLCVTQDPDATVLKAQQLEQIPDIVRNTSLLATMCLEIHQYHGSAWCALETMLFIAENKRCRPMDFLKREDRRTFRFGMNVADASQVNANENILRCFTDQPLTCGVEADVPALSEFIGRAMLGVSVRNFRWVTREIKYAVGMDRLDDLGIMIAGLVRDYITASLFADGPSAADVLTRILEDLSGLGYALQDEATKEKLVEHLNTAWQTNFILMGIREFGLSNGRVRVRSGGAYDHGENTKTSYAFVNQPADG